MHTTFANGTLRLEGDIHLPAAGRGAAVICHPHPQYGGDMNNHVVRIAEAVMQELGFATLRFNFRGVGESDGCFDHGVGEAEDAKAAVAHLRRLSGMPAATLIGYSFGSMVALQAGPRSNDVERIVAIAPPLAFFDLRPLETCSKSKLFLLAECDTFCDSMAAVRQIAALPTPTQHHIIAGADHFFGTHTEALATALRDLITG